MKHAVTISAVSCKRGHLHITFTDAAGGMMQATLGQDSWERFVKAGDDCLLTRALGPAVISFEVHDIPCEGA